ncbi:hypothetical protein INR75_15200 [Zunongwangia sp. SCSIO 43204]|uniref:hypothetical protein n=1 Tax=Zunongwangia sp. SCSIO 43204 TaxID=2779359 RepID=UPI001CA954D3|nr:hypothetical protein [Zunongwangia sp. SCSIO 43204]UAB83508.1 hypothetical protein INR75_15200 [Zunongwangia sp. SCSIO 43204]
MLTNLHPPKVIEFALSQITEILKKHIEIASLYYFGMQSSGQGTHNSLNNDASKQQQHYHFYLLLLSKHISPNAVANLSDIVRQDSGGKYTISLLLYMPKQIIAASDNNKYFFSKIIQSGGLVEGSLFELAPSQLSQIPELDIKGITNYTQDRIAIAKHCLHLSTIEENAGILSAHLIRLSFEQLCLGTIYAFLQYHPQHHQPLYLFKLVQFCYEIPPNIFSENLFEQSPLKRIFCFHHTELRYRSSSLFSVSELSMAHSYSQCLLDYLLPIVNHKLQTLKKASHENEKT